MIGDEVLLVGAAPAADAASFYTDLIRGAQFVVAADGGVRVCREAGRTPDLVVGDLDSIEQDDLVALERERVPIERFDADKDASDLELAIQIVRQRGATSVVVTATFADRFDHTIAALGTLLRAADLSARAKEPGFDAYVVAPGTTLRLHEPANATLSVFAFDSAATVTLDGVRFPLDHATLGTASSLGLSNVAVAFEQLVSAHSAPVLVVVPVHIPGAML